MLFLLLVADKFKKKEYPTPDIASILKVTSTVGAKTLMHSSNESTDKGADEVSTGLKSANLKKGKGRLRSRQRGGSCRISTTALASSKLQ